MHKLACGEGGDADADGDGDIVMPAKLMDK